MSLSVSLRNLMIDVAETIWSAVAGGAEAESFTNVQQLAAAITKASSMLNATKAEIVTVDQPIKILDHIDEPEERISDLLMQPNRNDNYECQNRDASRSSNQSRDQYDGPANHDHNLFSFFF
uniref:Uncharacterized protein n=1 Tax=Romanomermis culicivorax TaxID=13658 RepID=A0A915IEJ2_ROMCU